MVHKKTKKGGGSALLAGVKKEMEKPRMTKSARIAERNLDTARIAERPSVSMPGTVHKILLSLRPNQLEMAQIAVEGAHQRYRNLRIENVLTDEHGDDVKLKKGARVEVTVRADSKGSTAPMNEVIEPIWRQTAGLAPGRRKARPSPALPQVPR